MKRQMKQRRDERIRREAENKAILSEEKKKVDQRIKQEAREFEAKKKYGTLRHVGLPESVDFIANRLGWKLDRNVESRPTPVRRLDIVADLDPPALAVELPEMLAGLDRLPLRGKTEPGSELFIGNEPIAVGEAGGFEYTLELEPGLNMVVVEAVDTAGNSSYFTQYVHATRRSQP